MTGKRESDAAEKINADAEDKAEKFEDVERDEADDFMDDI